VTLDPAKWDELYANLDLAEQMIPGRERRSDPRHDYNAQVMISGRWGGTDELQSHLVRARNISASGLGLIHNVEVPVGSTVAFTTLDLKGVSCTYSAVCSRADLVESGIWDIGLAFDAPIDPSRLVEHAGVTV